MSDAHTFSDGSRSLSFRAADRECQILSAFYAGLKFNLLRLSFLPSLALDDHPDRDEMDIFFNVSGGANDLTSFGFAHRSWWPLVPASGITERCVTAGFGCAWRIVRIRCGYRLQGVQYVDGLTKAAVALFPASVAVAVPSGTRRHWREGKMFNARRDDVTEAAGHLQKKPVDRSSFASAKARMKQSSRSPHSIASGAVPADRQRS